MLLPPAVVVHGLADARLALSAGRPVTLLSATGAASFAGVGWWRAVMAAAGAEALPHVLDCGAAPGRALEALHAGQRLLVLDAGPAVFADVAARAAALGGTLLAVRPPALDLGNRGTARRLAAWLAHAEFGGGAADSVAGLG